MLDGLGLGLSELDSDEDELDEGLDEDEDGLDEGLDEDDDGLDEGLVEDDDGLDDGLVEVAAGQVWDRLNHETSFCPVCVCTTAEALSSTAPGAEPT